jgi:hypothetical protein
MTVEPAWAAFQEADLGMLAPGRYADFTALSGDPRAAAPGALRALEVRLTVVGGRIAYAAEGAAVSASSHRR